MENKNEFDYKLLEINKIDYNPMNPNELVESLFEHLKHEIERVGFLQPVLVRSSENGRYECVDGQHRLEALKELGKTEVPCIVTEMDEKEAKVQVINMNRIKGELNPVKFAELLGDLETLYDKENLVKLLAMSDKEIDAFKILAEMDDEFIPTASTGKEGFKTFAFDIDEALVGDVEKALEATGKDNKNSQFLELCFKYNAVKAAEEPVEMKGGDNGQ